MFGGLKITSVHKGPLIQSNSALPPTVSYAISSTRLTPAPFVSKVFGYPQVITLMRILPINSDCSLGRSFFSLLFSCLFVAHMCYISSIQPNICHVLSGLATLCDILIYSPALTVLEKPLNPSGSCFPPHLPLPPLPHTHIVLSFSPLLPLPFPSLLFLE